MRPGTKSVQAAAQGDTSAFNITKTGQMFFWG